MINIKILFFASSRGLAGCAEDVLDLESATITDKDFLEVILNKHQKLFCLFKVYQTRRLN